MDDGDGFIPSVNGRAGSWLAAHDDTPGAMMFPPSGLFAMSDSGDPCHGFAAHARGGQFTIWGANFSFGLGSPYSALAYSGFSFWAKASMSTGVVRVSFPDGDTFPDGGICSTSGGATGCWDHYGKRITLPSTWTKMTILFSELTTDGWGSVGRGFDPSRLYRIEFDLAVGAQFDVWIDEVAFIK
jgi:hypothetical protein